MVITMSLKHVIPRGKTFYFRMRVPQDCTEKVGKKEIVQSLKTKDWKEAQALAKELAEVWTERFKRIQGVPPVAIAKETKSPIAAETEQPFKQQLIDRMKKNLPAILDEEIEESLKARINCYSELIRRIQKNDRSLPYAVPELGTSWPFNPPLSPGRDRRHSRDLIEILNLLLHAVANEMIKPPAAFLKKEKEEPVKQSKVVKSCPEEHSISDVAELMLSSKKRIAKTEATVRADVRLLQEWVGKKNNVADFTKKDLIDFVQNCLPYIPTNILKKKEYKGKSLRECVKLTKGDPEQYPPISFTTCGNRLVNIAMVFNYAKDQLGLITVNPARSIDIPEVRVVDNGPRGFTPDELTALWRALATVLKDVEQRPSRYWATVLSLYHGFRLNEICSLFLNDVYEDKDGILVIDVNESHATKSVKNKSSVRIIPVHPFVRDQLDFKGYVQRQKSSRSEGLLFFDVSFIESKGYRDQVSQWFSKWKKEWLDPEAQYKHFHDLRYTFIQTAQNSAKMPDRHAQEITGHSIEGVSAVHLGYSGRLKPAALLEELQKVKYGWEAEPRAADMPKVAIAKRIERRKRIPSEIKHVRKRPLPVKCCGVPLIPAAGQATE